MGLATVVRSDLEMSLVWARNNPSLLVERITTFQEEHPPINWQYGLDLSRSGFITLIAYRRV